MHSLGYFYLKEAFKSGVSVRIAHAHTNNTLKNAKYLLKRIMCRLYSKYATDLFACSEDAGRYIFGEKKFLVVNNAIDSKKFVFDNKKRINKRKELNLENKFIIGSVGRFTKQKNQKFSIDVANELTKTKKNVVLLLIGSGPMLEEMKQYALQKGLEKNVVFLGNRDDMVDLYQAMDVFLMPSLFEGLGIVAVEAQAAGTPVVCTDTLPKEINVTPLLKRMSLKLSPTEWANTIVDISSSPFSHNNMYKNIVDNNYDIKIVSKKLEEFYLSRIKRR